MKMNDYLSILGFELANSDRLYDSGFITYVRVAAVSGSLFVRAQCCAEMRKGVSYVVDIKLLTLDAYWTHSVSVPLALRQAHIVNMYVLLFLLYMSLL